MSHLDHLHKAILAKMDEETRRIVDEEAKNAADRVEERVRGLAGEIATKVASWVSYQAMRDEIRITVALPERKLRAELDQLTGGAK